MSTSLETSRPTFEFSGAAPFSALIDERSGELVGLVHRDDPQLQVPVNLAVVAIWGGRETVGPVGGLEYPGAQRQELSNLRVVRSHREDRGDATSVTVSARDGEWEIDLHYELAARPPLLAVGVTVRRAAGASAVYLRDLELVVRLPVDEPARCVVNAPGNQMRADIGMREITAPLRVFGPAAMHGGPSFVALTEPERQRTTVIWPVSKTEVGTGELTATSNDATFTFQTDLAGQVDATTGLRWDGVRLGIHPGGWPEVRSELSSWYDELELSGPKGRPDWIQNAHIYEAHIGFSVFAGAHHYEQYPTVQALCDDLSRIQELGFDVIQLMPRHPYPSYNVHDYADIDTTYGDEAEIRNLVGECHAMGMRVLLDIIIHGVIDKEVMEETLASVKEGPYAGALDDGTLDYLADTREDIAWARHIVEYAPYWRAGSPPRHPLADEQPGWFMRDSSGEITRRYTKAFDIANPSWQRYFIDHCLALTERLGTDGFRVDAPTYNNFATWGGDRPWRASYGPMAAVPLIADLKAKLHAVRPDATVYTEPGGALFRATADMTYNYDEHWLVESLLAEPDHPQRDWRMVRNGRDLARWLMDRDLSHPPEAGIVHHVDSHDSIWWRLPGEQWRRERFGREATIALVAVFALGMRGAYMTFMGGEEGIEPELRRAHALRRRFPELGWGSCEYLPAVASCDQVLSVNRRLGTERSLVLVNLSGEPVQCRIAMGDEDAAVFDDHWNQESFTAQSGSLQLPFGAYQPRILRPA